MPVSSAREDASGAKQAAALHGERTLIHHAPLAAVLLRLADKVGAAPRVALADDMQVFVLGRVEEFAVLKARRVRDRGCSEASRGCG